MPEEPSTSPVEIRHNASASRYEAGPDNDPAFAEYILAGNRQIFTHTWVPPAARSQGLAAALVRAALDDARRSGRRVEPRCSYVARFIARHPEYRDLLAS